MKGKLQLRGFRGRRSDEWYENYFKTRRLAKPIKGREATIEVDDYHYHQEELNMPINNEDKINDYICKRWGNVLEELAKHPIGHNHDKETNEEGDREEGDSKQTLQSNEPLPDDDV